MWLVPLLPFLAFLIILFFGKRMPDRGHTVGIAAVGIGLVLSIAGFIELASGAGGVEKSWTWFAFEQSGLELEFGMNYDFLTGVMFLVVTIVSLLVQIYSTGYMHDDKRYTWFFAALSLFTASMLLLVIANNLLLMLVGWEGVGVCSYFLIGHYWEEKEYSSAAIKAFITTRIGDVGFLFGIFVLFIAGHTFNVIELNHAAEEGELHGTILTVGALLLFCGAVGKSAQFPLHVWLPDAMAGPTPVSALIHAATMVAAGVYLVARLFAVFAPSPTALTYVAFTGGITMLIAALLALVQEDIKRVLAYSTVSQLGYMMAALGLGPAGHTAAMFHLFTHAFFKALLFLGAGSVIHAVHSNNMSDMGGLRKPMPVTFWTFVIGSAALAGIPPLAGFWSKDEIIAEAFTTGHYVVWTAAIITALLTAFYMTRAISMTFLGTYRGHGHPHESPRIMTVPLVILAALAATAGFFGAPFVDGGFRSLVRFGEEAHLVEFDFALAGLSVALALVGITAGWFMYRRFRERDPLRRLGPLYTFLDNKYYLDDIYLKGIVRPIQYAVARAVYWTNQRILDGVVNGFGRLTRLLGRATDATDRTVVDGAVNRVAIGAGWTGGGPPGNPPRHLPRAAGVLFSGG